MQNGYTHTPSASKVYCLRKSAMKTDDNKITKLVNDSGSELAEHSATSNGSEEHTLVPPQLQAQRACGGMCVWGTMLQSTHLNLLNCQE
jgi:hypothetical protein